MMNLMFLTLMLSQPTPGIKIYLIIRTECHGLRPSWNTAHRIRPMSNTAHLFIIAESVTVLLTVCQTHVS